MATDTSDEENYYKVGHLFLSCYYGFVQKSTTRGPVFNKLTLCQKKKTLWKGEEQSSFNVLANEKIKCGNSFKCNYHVIAWANDEYCAVNSLWRNAVLLTNQIQELWYSLHLFYLKVRSMLNYFFSNIQFIVYKNRLLKDTLWISKKKKEKIRVRRASIYEGTGKYQVTFVLIKAFAYIFGSFCHFYLVTLRIDIFYSFFHSCFKFTHIC